MSLKLSCKTLGDFHRRLTFVDLPTAAAEYLNCCCLPACLVYRKKGKNLPAVLTGTSVRPSTAVTACVASSRRRRKRRKEPEQVYFFLRRRYIMIIIIVSETGSSGNDYTLSLSVSLSSVSTTQTLKKVLQEVPN